LTCGFLLSQVDENKRVYFIGHSLGGALAAIGALRSHHRWQTTASPNQVAGVWLFGCPRIGNAGWQTLYNSQLLTRTLRMSNYADFAARLPLPLQVCPLTNISATYSFYHIGRSLVLCPNPSTGLVDGVLEPRGSERLDCGILSDVPDLSIRTHWLGSYLDAWRRHYMQATGLELADDARLRSVMCEECSLTFLNIAKQINVPARAGGPVTCAVHANCSNRRAWDAAALVGSSTYMKSYSPLSVCMQYLCS
jgi:pimeloyl-ACP methyl ester carboxylesterase